MTFNPFRTIKSLEEDFKELGLDVGETLTEMKTLRVTDENTGIKPLTESTEEVEEETLEEGLKRVKMKRMKASERGEARREYRKKKSQIKRKLKKLRKKPAYKRKKAKLKRMKGDKEAGARKKFMVTSQEIAGSLIESVESVKPEKESLVEAFEQVNAFTSHFLSLCEGEKKEEG